MWCVTDSFHQAVYGPFSTWEEAAEYRDRAVKESIRHNPNDWRTARLWQVDYVRKIA